jgi:hypothetical protein
MPRAAMSVATSTRMLGILPARKPSSARSRAFCDLLPWIAAAPTPCALEVIGDAVGAVLGAREHQHALDADVAQQLEQQARLSLLVDEEHLLVDLLGGRRHRRPPRR